MRHNPFRAKSATEIQALAAQTIHPTCVNQAELAELKRRLDSQASKTVVREFAGCGERALSDEQWAKILTEDTALEANRAALPTTPKYPNLLVREEGMEKRRSALDDFPVLPVEPVSPEALFAQLREMGVGCESCKWEELCRWCAQEVESDYCSEWDLSAQSPPET